VQDETDFTCTSILLETQKSNQLFYKSTKYEISALSTLFYTVRAAADEQADTCCASTLHDLL